MKFFIILFIIILGAFDANGQRKSDEVLLIRNKVHDFGIVKSGNPLNARYYLINRGNTDIKINDLRTDCICTEFFISNYTIQPKDSIYIELTLDTKSVPYGEHKIYAIVNADTDTKLYKLTLKAVITK